MRLSLFMPTHSIHFEYFSRRRKELKLKGMLDCDWQENNRILSENNESYQEFVCVYVCMEGFK
jgi:hypothetical protein